MKNIKLAFTLAVVAVFISIRAIAFENTYAVLVAINDYKNLGDRSYPIENLEKFKTFLMSDNGGNVPDSNICFIKNNQATKQNIINKSVEIFSKAKNNDRVIFYFHGHGNNGFFSAYDSVPEHYLYFSEVKKIFQSANCKTKILFANACNSGSLMDGVSKKTKRRIENEISELEKDSMLNIAIMLSSKGSELSWGGRFSDILNTGLTGKADKNKNGVITIKELFYYVYDEVVNKSGGQQTPVLFGNFDLNLIIGWNYEKSILNKTNIEKIKKQIIKDSK